MAFQEIVQLIGITAAFPVLLLVGFIVLAPVGVYEGGQLPAELLALLKRELRLRIKDQTEELSRKTLERLGRIMKAYERSVANAEEEDLRGFDAVMAGFTDNAVDPAFLAQRRTQLQQLLVEQLKKRSRETAPAADLIKRWQYWVMREKIWLYWVAVQDVGVKAFRHFMRTVGRCMTDAGALGIIAGVLIWGLSLSKPYDKPKFLIYLGNSAALGAFIGLAYAVTVLASKAWKQYIATVPTEERRGWRRSGSVLLAFMFSMGPILYFGLLRKIPTWMDRLFQPLLDSVVTRDVLIVLFLLGMGVFFLVRSRDALRNWRTPGILSRPQRLEELSFAIVGIASALLVIGPLGFWLVGDRPIKSGYLIWWGSLIFAALLFAAGIEAMAWFVRYRERRSRMRMFEELGLQPKRFRPIWLIVLMWSIGFFLALPITAWLILVFDPGLAEQGEIPNSALLIFVCVLALVVTGGIVHLFLAKRRRKLEDQRLIAEYRNLLWAEEGERPGDH
jgi:hypothetical protein